MLVRLLLILFLFTTTAVSMAAESPGRTLIIGSEQDFPPFAVGQSDADADGFTVDLWRAVAKEAGLDSYKILVRPWNQIIQEFKAGKIDVLINMAQSEERGRYADFSVPHVTVHGAIFVRKGDTQIRSEADLAGKAIIVFNADLAHEYAVSRGWEKQLVLVSTAKEGLNLLAAGKHDAMLVSKLAGMQTLNELHISNIRALDVNAGFSQKFSFAVPKGDAELLARLNEGLALTKASGVYDVLYHKWFGVFEVKEPTFRDMLKYFAPAAVLILVLGGYLFNRRRIERNVAERELRESEERFRQLITLAPVPMCFVTSDGVLRYINNSFIQTFGYTLEDIPTLDEWWRRAYPDEQYRSLVLETWDKAVMDASMDRTAIKPYEYLVTCKNGDALTIEISGITIGNDFLATFFNITERKNAEESLRNAKRYTDNIIQGANAIIVGLDTEGYVTLLNHTAEEICGYSLAELRGKNWFETICPREMFPEVYAEFERLKNSGTVDTFENPIITSKGVKRTISWRNSPLMENDTTAGTISFGIDITEHRKVEEQLRQSLKMESIGRLAGGVAHDFNNQLTVILGYAEISKLGLSGQGKLYQNLEQISRAAEHSRDITRQLLAFSRQELIAPKPVDLNAAIKDIQKALGRLIGEDIVVTFNSGDDLWPVNIDPSQLDQIIMNLAVNARDAMPKGGKLDLSTLNMSVDEDYCLERLEAKPGDYVRLSCSDSGHGIDSETLKHIFEPFFTTKEVGKGTGLGLATVYGIVSQNNGFIDVCSKPGSGAEFNIFLPRHDVASSAQLPNAHGHHSGTGTILLVEDDETVREMTMDMLEVMGYIVAAAATPHEAVELCKNTSKSVDLILSDVIMPGMSGKEMVEKIGRIRPGIKVLYMSGYTSDILSEKGVMDTGLCFIQKPFDMNSLGLRVREAMSRLA